MESYLCPHDSDLGHMTHTRYWSARYARYVISAVVVDWNTVNIQSSRLPSTSMNTGPTGSVSPLNIYSTYMTSYRIPTLVPSASPYYSTL